MKLYFYFLENMNKVPTIRCEECEVIEKPGTYYAVDEFPYKSYCSRIEKSETNRVITDYGRTIIILTEPNKARAAEAFINECNYRIRRKEEEIRMAKESIIVAQATIGVIERWRDAVE